MSLVPILYTSLILFSILMFVIVTASYIAYKIRNRNSENETKEIPNRSYINQPVAIPEHRSYQPQAIRVVSAIKNPELKKEYLTQDPGKRDIVVNERTSPRQENNEKRIAAYEEPKENNTESFNRRTNPGSYKSRLEILNRVVPEESLKEKFTVSGSGSIALPKYYENFRAIQYYSDRDEEYLYKPSRHYS